MLLAVALGMPIALMRLYGPTPVRWLAVVYVEFFRGIPVLLLLFFLYFVLGSAWHVDAFTHGGGRLRPELRRLRSGNLSRRHRSGAGSANGRRRRRWACRGR